MLRVTILAGLVVCCGGCAAPETATNSVQAEIEGAWRQHIAAAVDKDLAGVLAIYDPSMVFVVPGSTDVAGLDAIADMERTSLGSSQVLEAQHTLHELRVFGDVAYEIGTIEGPVRTGEGPARLVTFPYMARWQRSDDGRWRLTYQVGR